MGERLHPERSRTSAYRGVKVKIMNMTKETRDKWFAVMRDLTQVANIAKGAKGDIAQLLQDDVRGVMSVTIESDTYINTECDIERLTTKIENAMVNLAKIELK